MNTKNNKKIIKIYCSRIFCLDNYEKSMFEMFNQHMKILIVQGPFRIFNMPGVISNSYPIKHSGSLIRNYGRFAVKVTHQIIYVQYLRISSTFTKFRQSPRRCNYTLRFFIKRCRSFPLVLSVLSDRRGSTSCCYLLWAGRSKYILSDEIGCYRAPVLQPWLKVKAPLIDSGYYSRELMLSAREHVPSITDLS